MNKTIFIGRPTRDPEVIIGSNDKLVARFTLAVERIYKRNGEENVDFIPIVTFGRTAKLVEDYVKKGRKICVVGEMRNNNYEKDGVKQYSFQIYADYIELLDKKSDAADSQSEGEGTPSGSNEFMSLPEGEKVPFDE